MSETNNPLTAEKVVELLAPKLAGVRDQVIEHVEQRLKAEEEARKAKAEAKRKAREEAEEAARREKATNRASMLQGAAQPVAAAKNVGLGRIAIAKAAAFRQGGSVDQQLQHRGWADTADHIRALNSATAGSGADLIPEAYSGEFIEYLRAAVVFRQAGARSVTMPGGQLDIGRQNGTVSLSWVGDPAAVNESSLTTGRSSLNAKKLMAVTAVSNDLIRRSVPGADGLVQADLMQACAVEEDVKFIRGVGSAYSPKGVRYQTDAANIFGANATFNYTNATADVTKMIRLVAEANVPLQGGAWLMAHRSYYAYLAAVAGTVQGQTILAGLLADNLMGFPIYKTSSIPTNLGGGSNESEIYFGVPAQCVIGDTLNMEITALDGAAYRNASGTVVSGFSQDEIAIRVIHEVDMVMRHTKAFSVLTGVNWV